MTIPFAKYQGTGNDFVIIDQRNDQYISSDDQATVKVLCDRRFGIGADGLILLQRCADYDFEMVYFNADGSPSSMCGNGGRCIVKFAHDIGLIGSETSFLAVDGPHRGRYCDDGTVALQMSDVLSIKSIDQDYFLDTGSPHYVTFEKDNRLIVEYGRDIRYSAAFAEKGVNVNRVEVVNDQLTVETYERGVEDETYSCGTGVTAAAIAAHCRGLASSPVTVNTKGGSLVVSFAKGGDVYEEIWLRGPAIRVYSGHIKV